ncbi:hypothetical protein Zmor_006062 [Zophobas morio]|uniref:HTH CENPB-type domain-containing protein n=1 Tax=Zophobas morio TaxID=2755281 RepID=A0AA38IT24_9CUCU|nr:hypothetical protein Zmor_006062 [Zophobas morio]
MPRTYKRKTNKASWTADGLQMAINSVTQAGVKIRQSAKMYNIPFSTLQIRLKKQQFASGPKLGRNSVFSEEEEQSIANHVKMMGKLFYGLTPKQLHRVAYDYAETNNIPNTFNKTKRLAGKDWLYNFLKRNPTVSKRKPENTSINCITSFNREEVRLFFDNLENVMNKYKFKGSGIYNVDETGINTVGEPEIILAEKGQKRTGTVATDERGKTVTVICAMSASDNFIPPMFFIFPRKRLSLLLTKDGPIDAIYHVSNNGWINEELIIVWLAHSKKIIKPSPEDPVLLILDNNTSHITYESYSFCKDNGIVMVSIPPHTSHRLQPLDVTFFGPLKLL